MGYIETVSKTILSSLPFVSVKKSKGPLFFVFGGSLLTGIFGSYAYSFFMKDKLVEDENEDKEEKKRANDYFPVQSPSERAKDHPIVGSV